MQVRLPLHTLLAAVEWLLACACCSACDIILGHGLSLRVALPTWAAAFLMIYYLPTVILARWVGLSRGHQS
jgi:hypothetical protein